MPASSRPAISCRSARPAFSSASRGCCSTRLLLWRCGWSYLPSIAPWLIRLLAASTPRRVEEISRALAALLAPASGSYKPLLKSAGAEDLVQRRGWLILYETEESRRAGQADLDLRRSRGIRWEELDEGTIRQLVPAIRPGPVWGVMLPDCEHTLDPYRLTVALAEDFVARGGTIMRGDVRTGVGTGSKAGGDDGQRTDRIRPSRDRGRCMVANAAARAWRGCAARHRARLSRHAGKRDRPADPAVVRRS